MRRTTSGHDAVAVRDDIAERFARSRTSSRPLGRIYQPSDFDVPAENLGALRPPGQLVTPEHLSGGHFMPRPERVDALVRHVDVVVERSAHDVLGRLHVLWLKGRSGVGKSVLLVQLLEEMVRAGRRAVWFGGEVSELEAQLRQTPELPKGGGPELLFVDDLYDPEVREELDLVRLARFLERNNGVRWPVVVTCGPPEFADTFLAAARYRGVELILWDVTPVRAVEGAALLDWYEQRSGKPALRGPAFEQAAQGDGLMVSMAAELEHGDLRRFGRHFTDRLAANGLDEEMRTPLALARLYVWTPASWFDEELRERLAHLSHTGDLSFVDSQWERKHIRLTHPHLADAIYSALRAGASTRGTANDLAKAFERALEDKDSAMIRRVMGAIVPGAGDLVGERVKVVDLAHLLDRMRCAWNLAEEEERLPYWSTPDDEAEALVLRVGLVPQRAPGVNGFEQRLHAALSALTNAHERWPLLWERLRTMCPDEARVEAWVVGAVQSAPKRRHPQWSYVWESLAGKMDTSAWQRAGQSWLGEVDAPPDWHFVWRRLFEARETLEWSRKRGRERLRKKLEGSDWTFVWQDLLQEAVAAERQGEVEALMRQGITWLSGREGRSEWAHVWQRLLEHQEALPPSLDVDVSDLLELGVGWLSGREDRPEWSYVWQRLLEHHEALPPLLDMDVSNLLELGVEWLSGREDRPEWNYVWERLLEHHEALPPSLDMDVSDLLELGVGWLSGREDRSEWTHVWERLLEYHEALPSSLKMDVSDLLELGVGWLSGREDRSEWAHVWQRLLEHHQVLPPSLDMDVSDLLELGVGWLSGREDRSEWAHVWQRLLEHHEALPIQSDTSPFRELLDLGLRRIELHPGMTDSPVLWSKLLRESSPDSAELIGRLHAWGRRWINEPSNSDSSSMGWVIEGLLDSEGVRAVDLPHVDAWLLRTHHASGYVVAAKRLAASPEDSGVEDVAARLVSTARRVKAFNPKFKAALRALQGRTLGPKLSELLSVVFELSDSAPKLPDVDSMLWGEVSGHKAFGVFFRIGVIDGLVHVSTLPREVDMRGYFPIGSRHLVKVLAHKEDKLSLALAQPPPTSALHHAQSEYKAGDRLRGQISGRAVYGVFAKGEGWSGLLHRTVLPSSWTEPWAELPHGTEVEAEVLEVTPRGLRLRLADGFLGDG
ncbi:MAG: hypothetical protein H6741_18785 [Alphaproteobacteria bacterium]|nr:hypothetical protein [Alphaproteobacteria bacterium]